MSLPSLLGILSTSPARVLSARLRAARAAPGATLVLEAAAGALRGWGDDGGDGGSPRAYDGPRLPDRFFLTPARWRGFEAVGPASPPVPFGARHGDAAGGDAYALVTARLLLPPPLPSVRAANAGLRTHVFAAAGKVAAPGGAGAGSPAELLAGFSAAAGVGVTMPVVAGFAVEANYAVWHAPQLGDATASFSIMLSA
jgi:hypothetical protein